MMNTNNLAACQAEYEIPFALCLRDRQDHWFPRHQEECLETVDGVGCLKI